MRRSKVLQNAPKVAFCNTFDLHYAILGLETNLLVFLRVAVLDRFYCMDIMIVSSKRIFNKYAACKDVTYQPVHNTTNLV